MSLRNHIANRARRPGYKPISHTFILRTGLQQSGGSVVRFDREVMSMGEHGSMNVKKDSEDILPEPDSSFLPMEQAVSMNRLEFERARTEAGKWEQRLQASPLGKTEQDCAAYYRDVLLRFERWFEGRNLSSRP